MTSLPAPNDNAGTILDRILRYLALAARPTLTEVEERLKVALEVLLGVGEEAHDGRRFARIELAIPATIEGGIEGGEETLLVDASAGGLRVARELKPGRHVVVRVVDVPSRRVYYVPGDVAWSAPGRSGLRLAGHIQRASLTRECHGRAAAFLASGSRAALFGVVLDEGHGDLFLQSAETVVMRGECGTLHVDRQSLPLEVEVVGRGEILGGGPVGHELRLRRVLGGGANQHHPASL